MRDIRNEIDAVTEIVPIPSIVGSIMSEMLSGEMAIDKLNKLIEADAVLTALVLRAANSAYYGYRGEVTTSQQAIILLGVEEINRLVLMYEMKQRLFILNRDQRLFLEKLWSHSVATAIISRAVSRLIDFNSRGEEFTSGLLHDLGKIVLVQHFSYSLAQTQHMIVELDMNDIDAEKQNLAISHDEIGGMLGEKWELPPMMIEVMKFHHKITESIQYQLLVAIVRLADLLSERWGIGIQEQAHEILLEEEQCFKILQKNFKAFENETAESVEQKLREMYNNDQEFAGLFT